MVVTAPPVAAPVRAAGGQRRRLPATAGRGDVLAVALLVVLPVLAFAVPAALGHPVLPGDDAAQNFPMRVLVGRQLRAGHLPLLDMRIWSGTPLLAGWNAGAAYPFTWLFAVLPSTAAWAVNQMLVAWAAGLGLFAFLRANRLRAFPAVLAGFTFAYGGAMDAQMVHFGLVAGFSWVPLQLLAVHRLTDPDRSGGRAGWCALLASAAALTLLAGEPRAIDVAAAVTVPYALWRLWRVPDRRPRLAAWVAGAALVAGALGMVQLLPGLHAVHDSQRAALTYDLFNSGSYTPNWLLLLLEPNLLGGSGSFGAPSFLASYNLTEVTGYVGILPWVAAFALLARLRWRRPAPEWLVWHVVLLIGIVLALGGNSPAWHVLIHVPLYNGQRLQSRNILIADLALAVLLGFWADSWLARRPLVDGAQPTPRRERVLAAAPALAAAAVGVVSVAWGAGMLTWLGVTRAMANQDGGLRPWFVPTIVLGVAAFALVTFGSRLRARRRRVLLGVLVFADLVAFSLTSLFQVWPSLGKHGPPTTVTGVTAAADPQPGPVVPVPDLHIPGRFAVYDPALIAGAATHEAGAPDQNLIVGGWSLQGYSSIVDGAYADATGSHGAMGAGQDVLSVAAIGNGTLNQVTPGALLTPPQYLVVDADQAATLAANGSPWGPDPAAGQRQLRAGVPARWAFGEPVALKEVDLPLHAASAASVALSAVTPAGTTVHLQTLALHGPADTHLTVTLPRAVRAVGLVATATAPVRTDVPVVVSRSGVALEVDGQLQAAVTGSQWHYVTQDGPLAVFAASHPTPPLTLQPPGAPGGGPASASGGRVAGASVRRLSGPALAPTSALVDAPDGAVVVRAVADISGWSARLQWAGPAGTPGPSQAPGQRIRTVPVRRHGLVQAVTVPPGRWVVRWVYTAPGLRTGVAASLAGLVALLGLVVAALAGRRRRQPLLSAPDGPTEGPA